jgi:hypothetical protein
MERFQNHIGKVCALVVPSLAHADRDHDRDNGRDNHERHGGDRDRDDHIPVVPEANTVWALIPFVGAVLLFSWRQFSRAKAQTYPSRTKLANVVPL